MSEEKLGQHYLAALNEAFPGVVLDHAWQTKDQLTVTVKVNYLPEVVEFLYYKQGGWLSVLFGNDERKLNGHYAVYYVLSMEKGTKCWVTVRVEVDANKPEYPSVTPRVPAAVWGEREVRDMYGLIPVGLPDERRLVLPDDWPDELYPLRKDSMDYRQRPAPTTDAETYEFINELGDKKNNVVPIGPLHVTSDEPGHFRLFVDGDPDKASEEYRALKTRKNDGEPVSEEELSAAYEKAAHLHAQRNVIGTTINGDIPSGSMVYENLEDILGGPKAVSEFLYRAGIDGVTFVGGSSGVRNYVAFSDKDILVDEHIRFSASGQAEELANLMA